MLPATWSEEASDVPNLLILRPVFDASQAVTALNCQINYGLRTISNDATPRTKVEDTKSTSFDVLDATNRVRVVNVAGLGNITFQQWAQAAKKFADLMRPLIP